MPLDLSEFETALDQQCVPSLTMQVDADEQPLCAVVSVSATGKPIEFDKERSESGSLLPRQECIAPTRAPSRRGLVRSAPNVIGIPWPMSPDKVPRILRPSLAFSVYLH